MKIIAYTPLHYGKAYLRYAVTSVAPFVDQHLILYTDKPSYGHSSDLPCPDTQEELYATVSDFPHIRWLIGDWHNESQHRGAAMSLALKQNPDLILPVDADEVWDSWWLAKAIREVWDANKARRWRMHGFHHMWRSFHWFCTDAMAPVRMIDVRHGGGDQYASGLVYHFGYAQSRELMRYKWSCHGHLNELRPGWYEDKFLSWLPGIMDVHPTCEGIWNPRHFDPTQMPIFMRAHPWFDAAIIQ